MDRRLSLLLLPACGPKPLTGDDVCHDVVVAVAARVAECASDPDEAAGVPDAFDEVDCRLDEDIDSGLEQWVGNYYACVGAMAEVNCELALRFKDDPGFWLGQEPTCARIYELGGDTGGGR